MREELGLNTTLVKGRSGIFVVKVDDIVVAQKTLFGFPSEQQILEAVRAALPET